MRTFLVIAAAWVLVIVVLTVVRANLLEWDALDRARDGWCELLPGGVPSADDPDCEDWSRTRFPGG